MQFLIWSEDGDLFTSYAALIALDMKKTMSLDDRHGLRELYESLSELSSFSKKNSPVKAGRWFSWNASCAEMNCEWFATRLLLQHQFPTGNPDGSNKSLNELRSDLSGLRVALQCSSWSTWYGVQVLRLVGAPLWQYYAETVEGVKSPSQGLAKLVAMSRGQWMGCKQLNGLVDVFLQLPELERIMEYHVLSRRHLGAEEHILALQTFVKKLWFYDLSVLSKRSSALSKACAPPECYATILHDHIAAEATLQSLLEDWRLLCLAEQSEAAQDLSHDLRSTVSAPMRLIFQIFESGKIRDGEQFLGALIAGVPDTKIIEDIHGRVKLEAQGNANRKQSPAQVQSIINASNSFEARGIPHPCRLDKSTFVRKFSRTKSTTALHSFQARREKLPKFYSKLMGEKTWQSLSEESLAKSASAWEWLRFFSENNLKQQQVKLDDL